MLALSRTTMVPAAAAASGCVWCTRWPLHVLLLLLLLSPSSPSLTKEAGLKRRITAAQSLKELRQKAVLAMGLAAVQRLETTEPAQLFQAASQSCEQAQLQQCFLKFAIFTERFPMFIEGK